MDKYDEVYYAMAFELAHLSPCLKRKYGCVIVKDGVVVASGYNRPPKGIAPCKVCNRANANHGLSYEGCKCVHAEQLALINNTVDLGGSTIYLACLQKEFIHDSIYKWTEVPGTSCNVCNNMLKEAGVIKLVNMEETIWV